MLPDGDDRRTEQNLDLELVARNALKPHMGKQILDEVQFLN